MKNDNSLAHTIFKLLSIILLFFVIFVINDSEIHNKELNFSQLSQVTLDQNKSTIDIVQNSNKHNPIHLDYAFIIERNLSLSKQYLLTYKKGNWNKQIAHIKVAHESNSSCYLFSETSCINIPLYTAFHCWKSGLV